VTITHICPDRVSITIHEKRKKDAKLLTTECNLRCRTPDNKAGPRGLSFSCLERRRTLGTTEGAELDEDGHILDHSSKGANQPGQGGEQVFFLL
jgi:hypothetical protein